MTTIADLPLLCSSERDETAGQVFAGRRFGRIAVKGVFHLDLDLMPLCQLN